MSHEAKIHPVQIIILKQLLFVPSAKFGDLQKSTGLESDYFKFHLARLTELSYVLKQLNGHYCLTTIGKEYANKLDTDANTIERQPKSAVILVIEKEIKGTLTYLVQERLKHPYFGFWGFPGGKIRWGETILQAAARELAEETGLIAKLTYRGLYHEHVRNEDNGELLEDKIFLMVHGTHPDGTLLEAFEGGRNAWKSLPEVNAIEKKYKSFQTELEVGTGVETFLELTQLYTDQQF